MRIINPTQTNIASISRQKIQGAATKEVCSAAELMQGSYYIRFCSTLVSALVQPSLQICYQLADAASFYCACFTHHVQGLRARLQATEWI